MCVQSQWPIRMLIRGMGGTPSFFCLALALLVVPAALLSDSGIEEMMNMVDSCSWWGKEAGRQGPGEKCGDLQNQPIPKDVPLQQTNFCLSAAQLSCSQAVREVKCEAALDNARVLGRCPRPSGDEEWECCKACLLGLAVGGAGGNCIGDTHFGTLRETAFLSCCHDTSPPPTGTGESDMCQEFAGELCAQTCVPVPGSYRCTCRPGYRLMSDGKSCSSEERCRKCSGGCAEQEGDDGEVVCTCPPGLTLAKDNTSCIEETQIQQEITKCPVGFQSTSQSNDCIDIDECAEGNSNCDLHKGERCTNTIGSYVCTATECARGFRYNKVSRSCEDIDECSEAGDDPACDSNQICENTEGSFKCSCKRGFRRDPVTYACIDINECQQNLHNCHQLQRCDNTVGSFVCVRDVNCGTGYTLNHQSGKCEDDNECELATDNCRFLGADWECRNTQGSFRCIKKTGVCGGQGCCPGGEPCSLKQQTHCPTGFQLQGQVCKDINECETGLAKCNPNQRCVNIEGNYLCSDLMVCSTGFKLSPSKTQCIDINECEEQEGLCSHSCENRWGSFRCRCRPGYNLHTDNRTCVDINECDLGVRCQGFCINQQGSYVCGCPPGYKMGTNKHTCQDINECETSDKTCQGENEVCINLAGSYRCNTVTCPDGYHRDDNRRTRCQRDNISCHIDDMECKRQPSTYTYNFITMVSNYSIPQTRSIKLFAVESRWGSTSPDFHLHLIQARVPPAIPSAVREDFNLNKQYGRATIELLRPLFGPQEILLELKTEFYNNDIFLGVSVFSIEIYVSQYSF